MGKKENDFRKRLLSTFKVEAQDHIKAISSGLVELEKTPPPEVQMEILETIYRDSHSLKGAARAVSMTDIETICQSLEGVFAVWKQKNITPPPELFNTLYDAVDTVHKLLSSLETGQPLSEKSHISKLIEKLSLLEFREHEPAVREQAPEVRVQEPVYQPQPAEPRPPIRVTETVRISTAKLSSLLLQAEEMLSAKQTAAQHYRSLADIVTILELLKKESSKFYLEVRTARRAIERKNGGRHKLADDLQVIKLQGFLDKTQDHIKLIESKLSALTKSSIQYNKTLERMVDDLLDDMKKAMMLPFSTILEGFPMLVRNISHEQGKEVELVIHGEDVEIDRRILEETKDPLIHLVRNSIDHGIEKPEVRVMNKKPRRGIITIAISHMNGSKVGILVSDDGRGIDFAKVKETAVKNGILSQAEAECLNDHEAMPLIFHSGVSTSPVITDISGRGLGLAIVREKVERLSGSITAETRLYAGTTFRILLPLTIATFRGVPVRAADQTFIIPTANVERVVRARKDDIKTVENRETISIDGNPVSYVRLESILELPQRKKREEGHEFTTALVLNAAEKRIAFGVDEMLGEQEVLVKGLGRQLSRVRNVAGAAVTGSGKPVPILNVQDMMISAVKAPAVHVKPATAVEEEEAERKSILIVEDSITSRMLLKNILESAGYDVMTAVDGIDAIAALMTSDFDLVVSDVEMPRMDGFDLTAKIRSDKKLAELPVVLVTALETREDRERGIDVGANAYIVKSSFDQSNLLEVVKRLI